VSEQIREHFTAIHTKMARWTNNFEIKPTGVANQILYHHALELGKEAAKKEAVQEFSHSLHTYTLAINIFTILVNDATESSDRVVLMDEIEKFTARKTAVRSKMGTA
jgi:hypothetical protein